MYAKSICDLPLWTVVAVLALSTGVFVCARVFEHANRQRTINPFSVKQSMDLLPTGLCFFEKNGNIILANKCMQKLCAEIIGTELQNADLLWNTLLDPRAELRACRLVSEGQPALQLPNGRVWRFSLTTMGDVSQLAAFDITERCELSARIKDRNLELALLNIRLRDFGDNVDELTRVKEHLDTKARIHSNLGQALMATRHYLKDGGSQLKGILTVWKQNVSALRLGTEATTSGGDPLFDLWRAAASAGIKLEIDGVLPSELDAKRFVVSAAAEALINAVRHANAKKLALTLWESQWKWHARFTNDGILPKNGISEGGGLGSLRRKAEQSGGSMRVRCDPEFELYFELPKGRSKSN